jgi:uncharacterized protein
MACAEAPAIHVDVVYCPGTGVIDLVSLSLPAGSTAEQALAVSGLRERHGLPAEGLKLGVWAKVKPFDTVLVDRDRVEIYRPLKVDPKEARRQRYQRHLDRRAAKPA